MKSGKLLIISCKGDFHSDYLVNKLSKNGYSKFIVRLNTEDFSENALVLFKNLQHTIYLKDSRIKFNLRDIKCVWYRRPEKISTSINFDIGIKQFIEEELEAYLYSTYNYLQKQAFWFNPLINLRFSSHKLYQLQVASELGMLIPDTIVSNKRKELLSFIKKYDTISTKGIIKSNFSLGGKIYSKLNRIIDKAEIFNNNINFEACPTLFQQYIKKQSDIRVVYVSGKIFAFEILSQENLLSKEDFRGVSPEFLKHSMIKLPNELIKKINYFCKHFGLEFSCLDFVKDKNNEYYFLENNPNGQWLWLELATGVKISDYIANQFIKICNWKTT